MRALVTGGAGFIGSNLVRELYHVGMDVTIVDNLSNGHKQFLRGVKYDKFIEDDFASKSVLKKIRKGKFDVVFHLAAVPRVSYSVEHPYETTKINLSRSVKLFEACSGNVGRVVFASSSSVYGGSTILPTKETMTKNPKSPYALQKSECEEYLKLFYSLYKLDSVSLRFFNVFGPHCFGDSPYSTAVAAWCDAVKFGKPLRSDGDGLQSRDLCYVDNVVQANVLAATTEDLVGAKIYNVGCGDRTTNKEILDFFMKKYPNLNIIHAPERAGDVKHTQADISAIEKDLGYKPKVKFWEGLELTMKWWNI